MKSAFRMLTGVLTDCSFLMPRNPYKNLLTTEKYKIRKHSE